MQEEGHESGSTVMEHECRDAVVLQPFAHFVSFAIHIVPEVTSARTYDDSHLAVTFCQICSHFHILSACCALPDVDFLLCLQYLET